MSCKPSSGATCRPAKNNTDTSLAGLVKAYRRHNQPDSIAELKFFREMPSIERAIHNASLAINDEEKRYSHQRRLKLVTLKRAKELLTASISALRECSSFHDLHTLLKDILSPVHGIGELYIYDTALRIGAYLKHSPEHVYLHAGTRNGAHALGLDISEGFLSISSMPKEIQQLEPHEIEDFLCIYKNHFKRCI